MKKVLIIGPFPNPISGVSLANKVVKEVLDHSNEFKTDFVNTSYPIFEDSVGSFSFKKFLFFIKINTKVFKIFKSNIVYITPGQTFFGVVKYALFILISLFLKKELVIHVHGNYLGKQYAELNGARKKIFYYLISKFTKGIVLSPSLKANLTPFLKDSKIFVIPNFGEDYLCEKKNKATGDTLKILYLSNLMEEKGILFLLEALKKLEKENITYKAKIAGNIDRELKELIFDKISNLKHTNYVGVVCKKEKRNLLKWSNIFVLPTFYKMEGQPISILEALATDNVIVATSHAGIPDIIRIGVNGYFIKAKSSDSIVAIFLFLHENKLKIKEISKNNKKYFNNNFTQRIFTKNIIKVLNADTKIKNI